MPLACRLRRVTTLLTWMAFAPAAFADALAAPEPASFMVCDAGEPDLAPVLRELRSHAGRRVDIDVYAADHGSRELGLARAVVLADLIEDALAASGIRRDRMRLHIRHEPRHDAPRANDPAKPQSARRAPLEPLPPQALPGECPGAWATLRVTED